MSFTSKFESNGGSAYRTTTNSYLPAFLMSSEVSAASPSALNRLRTPREPFFDQPPYSLSVFTDPVGNGVRGGDQQSPRKCALVGLPHQHNPGSQADPGAFQSPGAPSQSCLRKRGRKRSGSGLDSSLVPQPPNVSLVDVDASSPSPVDLSASVVSPSLSINRSKRVTFADEVGANASGPTSPMPIHGQISPSAIRSPPAVRSPLLAPRSHSSFAFQSPQAGAPNAAALANPVAALSPIRDHPPATLIATPSAPLPPPAPAPSLDRSLLSRSVDGWRPSATGTPQRPGQKNWITVFGFPLEGAADVLETAREVGPIVQHRLDAERNWVHIRYSSAADAYRALHALSARVIRRPGREFMIGAQFCNDPAVLSTSSVGAANGSFQAPGPNPFSAFPSLSRPAPAPAPAATPVLGTAYPHPPPLQHFLLPPPPNASPLSLWGGAGVRAQTHTMQLPPNWSSPLSQNPGPPPAKKSLFARAIDAIFGV